VKIEDRNLVTRLFTAATEILEDHHGIAVYGQSSKRSRAIYTRRAQQLQQAADDLSAIARVIRLLAKSGDTLSKR
jgi:hypothetical protein